MGRHNHVLLPCTGRSRCPMSRCDLFWGNNIRVCRPRADTWQFRDSGTAGRDCLVGSGRWLVGSVQRAAVQAACIVQLYYSTNARKWDILPGILILTVAGSVGSIPYRRIFYGFLAGGKQVNGGG
jgi:hypothetical protein